MVVAVEVVFGVEVDFPVEPPLPDGDFVLGTITVTVTLGVVFVIFVPPLVGVVVSPVPVVGFLPLPAPGLNDANSTSDALLVRLVSLAVPDPVDPDPVDPDPLEPEPPPEPLEPQFAVVWSWRHVSWSSAAVSCSCAWLSCRSAAVGSRSARS